MLTIPAPVIAVMQEHAFAGYPGEAVALLFGSGQPETRIPIGSHPGRVKLLAGPGVTVTRAVPLENIQDKLHALDPAEHPRTSRNGFQVNGRKMQKAVDEALALGEHLVAIAHSHIDCAAYFSQEDKDMAAPPPERVPNDPSLLHVVMACWPDGMREANGFFWNGQDFAAFPLPGFAKPIPLPRKA